MSSCGSVHSIPLTRSLSAAPKGADSPLLVDLRRPTARLRCRSEAQTHRCVWRDRRSALYDGARPVLARHVEQRQRHSLRGNDAILSISAGGGSASPVTSASTASPIGTESAPFFLPDGRRFLYSVGSGDGGAIYVGSVDSRETRKLLDGAVLPTYANGFLVFGRNNTVMAQRFNADRQELSGDAVPLVHQLRIRRCAFFPCHLRGLGVRRAGVSSRDRRAIHARLTRSDWERAGDPERLRRFQLRARVSERAAGGGERHRQRVGESGCLSGCIDHPDGPCSTDRRPDGRFRRRVVADGRSAGVRCPACRRFEPQPLRESVERSR